MAEQKQTEEGTEDERNVVSDEHKISDTSAGDHVRALREQWSPARANEALENAIEDKPLLAHLLDLRIVGQAAAIAAVVAILLWIIIGPATAGIALLVLYFGGWYVLARRSYESRRKTRPVDSSGPSAGDEDDEREGADGSISSDVSPFTADQKESGG